VNFLLFLFFGFAAFALWKFASSFWGNSDDVPSAKINWTRKNRRGESSSEGMADVSGGGDGVGH